MENGDRQISIVLNSGKQEKIRTWLCVMSGSFFAVWEISPDFPYHRKVSRGFFSAVENYAGVLMRERNLPAS